MATQIPSEVPSGVSQEGDGIVVGSAGVPIDAYIDFQCPFCRQFEENNGLALRRMVADGIISMVYHPLGFLDRLSTTAYSSRAASASGCASDAGSFDAYERVLFANQPPEGSAGLSDQQLIELGRVVGIDDPGFAACVGAHRYIDWVAFVTERAIQRGVSGTPSVFVAGVPVPANAVMIAAAASEMAR
jgi:protein-disulfide isomerase